LRLKQALILLAVVLVVTVVRDYLDRDTQVSAPDATTGLTVEQAAERRLSEVMLDATGTVQRTLADDNEGSRHQRFILALPSGHTVLVAHNIDLAPRVPLDSGDPVSVHGQYEWNERGGVLHWTHHDPAGRHEGGWIEHRGRRYE
jgi:hypothetical protein